MKQKGFFKTHKNKIKHLEINLSKEIRGKLERNQRHTQERNASHVHELE